MVMYKLRFRFYFSLPFYFVILYRFQYQTIMINAKQVNASVLFFQEARCIADKAVGVPDMDETVNRDVTITNHEAN